MIMFGSFLPSLLVGFSTTNFTRAGEPTLSWNQLRSLSPDACRSILNARYGMSAMRFQQLCRQFLVCNIDQTHIWELSKIGVTTKTHRAALLPTLSLCD